MKRFFLSTVLLLLSISLLTAQDGKVVGPAGDISFKISLPEGFNPATGRCPMVILMHGIFSSKDFNPMPALARGLAQAGIASMTAGRLSADGTAPDGLVLIAPGSVIKNACQNGKFFNATFDPKDPPEFIRCWGFMKLGREYLLTTQELDIYGTAEAYEGPVRILHGTRDGIVPMWCSEKSAETYGARAELVTVEGENHTITRRRAVVVESVVAFFRQLLR